MERLSYKWQFCYVKVGPHSHPDITWWSYRNLGQTVSLRLFVLFPKNMYFMYWIQKYGIKCIYILGKWRKSSRTTFALMTPQLCCSIRRDNFIFFFKVSWLIPPTEAKDMMWMGPYAVTYIVSSLKPRKHCSFFPTVIYLVSHIPVLNKQLC